MTDSFAMVKRELLERIALPIDFKSTDYLLNLRDSLDELRAVLAQEAGPVVERQADAWRYAINGMWEWCADREHAVRELALFHAGDSAEELAELQDEGLHLPQALYTSPPAPVLVMPGEPMPITEGMDRLMEAYRLGEFRLEGGSPTVEAMSCKSFDENADAVRDHDFDSYAAGYQAAIYEEASSLLGHIACLDKAKELNQ